MERIAVASPPYSSLRRTRRLAAPARARVMSRARRATRRSFAHPKCDVDATVESSFAFASRVEVTVPIAGRPNGDVARALDDAARELDGSMRYEAMMSVADALEPRFVREHVRRWRRGKGGDGGDDAGRDGGGDARFGLVTAETRADSDDCWCVTPSGRFVGSVMRDEGAIGITERGGREG